MAQTLGYLAFLHFETENLPQAAKEIEEAVSINRERWKANSNVAADDLARSLIIASLVQQGSSAKCQLTREAASVAQNQQIRDLANKKMAACTPR